MLVPAQSIAVIPTPAHVVVLVLENHGYGQIRNAVAAPYLNSLVDDPYSALFTQSFGLSHPSQPNYLQLFSGSNQGILDNALPGILPFTTANLGASLLNNAHTFIGYSEDLPAASYNGEYFANYVRKHNPWVNWQGASLNGIPASSNQPFTAFPSNYNLLPDVSFVVPNLMNDMHDGTDPSRIATGDTWVQQNLNGYIQWAKINNSLLIITFDEDDGASNQQVFTLLIGDMVQHGTYANVINHYNILRMLEDMYALPHAGNASTASTIDYCWNSCYQITPYINPAGPLTVCNGNFITLTSSPSASYLWSTGATTSSISVALTGNYTVTVPSINGCSGTSLPVVVTAATAPTNATLFTETIGSVVSTTLITTHETNNGFDNDSLTMSGSGEIRNTNASTGYAAQYPAASGLGNAFLTNTAGKYFIISGINTTGLNNIQLSFGVYKNNSTGVGADGSNLSLQTSTDGITYNNTLTIPALPTGTGPDKWFYVTATGTIPAVPNLRIQFKQNGTVTQYRIDDIRLQYSTAPTITANGPLTFCQGGNVTLTSSSATNNLWSNGATNQSIVVTTPGIYSVVVNCASSTQVTITTTNCTAALNLKVFLEGYYSGTNSMMPVVDPVNFPTICDSITVELHDTTAGHSLVCYNKNTINTNGNGMFIFPATILNNIYYVVIRHRSTIETWTKNPVSFSSSVTNLDLTIPDSATQVIPAPILSSISPSSANAGSSAFTLTLTGSSFVNSSVAQWNGVALTTTYISNTQLTAIVPAATVLNTGSANITVFNPAPGGGTSSIQLFSINYPAPVLTAISPSSVTAGSSGFTMVLTGSNFSNTSVAQWNGISLTTSFVSSSQLNATVPPSNVVNTGTTAITVFTPAPGGGTSIIKPFTINNPAAVMSSISPSVVTAGAATFDMTVTGSNFVNGAVVQFNGVTLSTQFISSTQLIATISYTLVLVGGTASITVVNPSPGGGTSNGLTLTINFTVPVLSSISPASITAGSAGFTMLVTGSNFFTSSVVKWNGVALTTTFISDLFLNVAIPTGNITTAGTASITVFNPTPGGGTSGIKTFTINPATVTVKKFLFDATKAETAGNADWVIDEDNSTPQRIPTPTQSNITGSTIETYWTGAISSWGIALVKSGNAVETLPSGTAITYGNAGNIQDLSNYDVFVVDEPNILFTASEKTAILNFVNNGGGLFMVADHISSDRNNDGWDSPEIWNDLMTNNGIVSNPFGLSVDLTNFSDSSSNILSTWSSNIILNGSQGPVSTLEFNAGASITISTTANPNAKGLIWRSSVTKNNTNIMCASSTYGSGRVFLVTDSSPIDDGTGASGNTLFVGWPLCSHTPLFMNASLWLAKLQ